MSNQSQITNNLAQQQDKKLNTSSSYQDSSSTLRDEVIVDVETGNGRLILKKSVRSGMVAIQYND